MELIDRHGGCEDLDPEICQSRLELQIRQMARNALFSRCRPISSHSSRSLAVRRREKGPSGPLTGYKESFISPSLTELLDIFRALADQTRLRIVALLRQSSEERRVRKGCVSQCGSRWSPDREQKKK